MKIMIDQSESKGMREFVLIGTSLRACLIKREENPSSLHTASVYILMDHRRVGFYIGETGDTSGGGFCNRFCSHKSNKKEKWWGLALCFTDTSELFSNERIRKWIESRLNEIAKNDGHLVMSTAEDKLREILRVCWLLGIPWGNEDYMETNCNGQKKVKKVMPTTKVNPSAVKHPPAVGGMWTGKTQLANLIAQREGKPTSRGHLLAYFGEPGNKSRRPCPKGSCWRKPLENAGVKFDKDDFVSDWTCARNPL